LSFGQFGFQHWELDIQLWLIFTVFLLGILSLGQLSDFDSNL
jgi:hypothetical protein